MPCFGAHKYNFINNFMKMIWPEADFCTGNIYMTLSFQIKKKTFQKFFPYEILLLVWILTPNKFWTKCPRCMTFAQAIVFQPYFMELTTLISIWLQLGHNSSSKLLKNFGKSSFFGNFKLPLWIFPNKLKCDF